MQLIGDSCLLSCLFLEGVPLNLRRDVWMKTSGMERIKEKNPSLFIDLLRSPHEADIVEIVKIDVPRTFPENIYFEVHQNKLFNVLVAFAHHNPAIGYCQGLNFIAGLILIVTKDEEDTFWLLKHLVENVASLYHTNTMYVQVHPWTWTDEALNTFRYGLQRDIHVLSELVRLREPLINEKVNELGIPWAVILTKWLICLYSEVLPTETVLRVWDVMFAEGFKIIFRCALAVISTLKEDIMECMDISIVADLFRNLAKDPRFLDCHTFMQSMFKIKLSRAEIVALRRNYKKE